MEPIRGVREEFGDLAGRFGAELVQYAFTRGISFHDAQDIVQRTFLKAWDVFQSGARPENPRAWLYRIVLHEASNERRASNTRRRARSILAGRDSSPPAEPAVTEEFRRTLDAVQALPPPYSESIALHYLQGLSIEETAAVLEIPSGTAKSQIARGLTLLRSKLHPLQGEEKSP
jgi:RNA polymerase sigma-70 factor (ECF subfamily)